MEKIFVILVTTFGVCFLLGVVYPVCAFLFYPIYKKAGGELKFSEYMRSL